MQETQSQQPGCRFLYGPSAMRRLCLYATKNFSVTHQWRAQPNVLRTRP